MGTTHSNEEHVRESAIRKFNEDRARLMEIRQRKPKKGAQDPLGMNFSYIPWLPDKYDPPPPVLYNFNPALYRVDRDYSNRPPYMLAYDRKMFKRMPNLFPSDSAFSTCTWTPPDPELAYIDPERQPADFDALNKCKRLPSPGQNPWGEDTFPLNIPTPTHGDPDPYKVHYVNEYGFFRPKRPEPYFNLPYFP